MVRIIVVMDCSGSMKSLQGDVIGSFNAFIEEQKQIPGEAVVCLTKFNHQVVVKAPVPLSDYPPLTEKDYSPMGLTALYDAIGMTIDSIHRVTQTPCQCQHCVNHKNILCIITDGAENASKDYTMQGIKAMLSEVQGKGWEVHFLAANMDAFQAGASLGIKAMNCRSWTATPQGVRATYTGMSASVGAFRTED